MYLQRTKYHGYRTQDKGQNGNLHEEVTKQKQQHMSEILNDRDQKSRIQGTITLMEALRFGKEQHNQNATQEVKRTTKTH